MCTENKTEITDVILLGFHDLDNSKIPFFIVSLLIYTVILCGNCLIISLVTFNHHLQIPMFYFLKHLGMADLLVTTNIVPMMLHTILNTEISVSVPYCLFQIYFTGVSGFVQCPLLAVMSYDRYQAICRPLHYVLVMTHSLCLQLVVSCWLIVFILVTSGMIFVYQLHFCDSNRIDHFYCDIGPVMSLSTSDTSLLTLIVLVTIIPMIFFPFILVISTYICILNAILNITTRTGRKKVFSTCSSHLTVVGSYFLTLITVYSSPYGGISRSQYKFLSLLYILITPIINPVIYSWRSREIRDTLKKYVSMALQPWHK